jgi:hypothetical protein
MERWTGGDAGRSAKGDDSCVGADRLGAFARKCNERVAGRKIAVTAMEAITVTAEGRMHRSGWILKALVATLASRRRR